jgi:uncharacterized membrane protein
MSTKAYQNLHNKLNSDIIIEYNKENVKEVSFETKENSSIKFNNSIESTTNQKRKKRNIIISPNSSKYLIFIITIWVVAFISFIIGFILHFGISVGITASSIVWTFSFILCVLASVFTYLYKKAQNLEDVNEKIKLLKFFPI